MKYEFVEGDRAQGLDGRILRRIRALTDIPSRHIRAGSLGGYIESESNLSHDGAAWVGGVARAYGGAFIGGDALLHGSSIAHEDALLSDSCIVGGQAQICGHATILGNTRVSGAACIWGDATVSGDAMIGEQMLLPGGAVIFARDMAQYFGEVIDGCLSPVTLYSDRDGGISVVTNTFSGDVRDYLEHVKKAESLVVAPTHLMMIGLASKRIQAAQATYARRQRMAA